MSAVRAKYQNGVLTPLEPLDLEEGAEVMVSVEGAAKAAAASPPTPKQGLAALNREAAGDEADDALAGSFNIERLVALQKEAFGDKVLPGDGTEFIREARESRSVS